MRYFHHSSHDYVSKLKPQKGGFISFAVIIFSIAILIILQAYMKKSSNHLLATQISNQTDQHQADKIALEKIFKEAFMEYYEAPCFGITTDPLTSRIKNLLAEMSTTDVTFTLVETSLPTLPTADYSFWPDTQGTTTTVSLGSSDFILQPTTETLYSSGFNYTSNEGSFRVDKTSGPVTFDYTVNKVIGTTTYKYKFNVSLYQVPISDFNLIAWVDFSSNTNIPESPPTLPTAIKTGMSNHSIQGLCFSKLTTGNPVSAADNLDFPFYYRELTQATYSVWQKLYLSDQYFNNRYRTKGQFVEIDLSSQNDSSYSNYDGITLNLGTDTDPSAISDNSWILDLDIFKNTVTEPDVYRVFISNTASSGTVIPITIKDDEDAEMTTNDKPVMICVDSPNVTLNLAGNLDSSSDKIRQTCYLLIDKDITLNANRRFKGCLYFIGSSSITDINSYNISIDGSICWNANTTDFFTTDNANLVSVTESATNAFRDYVPRYLVVHVTSAFYNN